MNKGKFTGDKYIKFVDFSKAVLWKDKELSLPKFVIIGFSARNTKQAIFIDNKKKEKWTFNVSQIMSFGSFKKVGQEEQWYFPISMAVKEEII